MRFYFHRLEMSGDCMELAEELENRPFSEKRRYGFEVEEKSIDELLFSFKLLETRSREAYRNGEVVEEEYDYLNEVRAYLDNDSKRAFIAAGGKRFGLFTSSLDSASHLPVRFHELTLDLPPFVKDLRSKGWQVRRLVLKNYALTEDIRAKLTGKVLSQKGVDRALDEWGHLLDRVVAVEPRDEEQYRFYDNRVLFSEELAEPGTFRGLITDLKEFWS